MMYQSREIRIKQLFCVRVKYSWRIGVELTREYQSDLIRVAPELEFYNFRLVLFFSLLFLSFLSFL